MLLPPVTLTDAPFSNLINPSASNVSRFSYIQSIIKYKLIKKRKIVYLDCVIFFNIWVRISNGSTIVSDDVWNFVSSHSLTLDLAKLKFSFFLIKFVGLESSLHII